LFCKKSLLVERIIAIAFAERTHQKRPTPLALRQRQEWEQRHQAELDKQQLATEGKDNCQSPDGFGTSPHSFIYNQEELVPKCQPTDGFGTSPHSFIYNQEELVPTTDIQNTPTTEEWSKPEHLEYIASLLADCENRDMLGELRECDIPPFAFKQACKHLQATKRGQIKRWVLELNDTV
jgi:hypothetical protein